MTTNQDITTLTEALRLTVPLHIREPQSHLASLPTCFDHDEVLSNIAARCAREYAPRGDMTQFHPTTPHHYTAARQAGLALSRGVAAACLLNPREGVEAFGVHFCAHPHEGCPLPIPKPTRRAKKYLAAFHAIVDDLERLMKVEAAQVEPDAIEVAA